MKVCAKIITVENDTEKERKRIIWVMSCCIPNTFINIYVKYMLIKRKGVH